MWTVSGIAKIKLEADRMLLLRAVAAATTVTVAMIDHLDIRGARRGVHGDDILTQSSMDLLPNLKAVDSLTCGYRG